MNIASLIVLLMCSLVMAFSNAVARDHNADLITIGTRFVTVHASTEHKAGDADEQFIEDVIIPAIADTIKTRRASLTNAQRDAVLGFLLASAHSASEEVSSIAINLYKANKTMFCRSVAKRSQLEQSVLIAQVNSGLASLGKPVSKKICK
jgi:hypothetical protein